jgi:hypothetical protein
MSSLIAKPAGHYRFLPGGTAFSCGVTADADYQIVRATPQRWVPWCDGIMAIRRFLDRQGLDQHALCAVELRCPEPFSFAGFDEFNRQYHDVLEGLGLLVEDDNPIARTNVSPVVNPPSEVVLHAFSWVRPSQTEELTYVVSGAAELPQQSLDSSGIVRLGETAADAMYQKAECVLKIIQQRLKRLGSGNTPPSAISAYTRHPLQKVLSDLIAPLHPETTQVGTHWYWACPPIVDLEFEMDARCVYHESILNAGWLT